MRKSRTNQRKKLPRLILGILSNLGWLPSSKAILRASNLLLALSVPFAIAVIVIATQSDWFEFLLGATSWFSVMVNHRRAIPEMACYSKTHRTYLLKTFTVQGIRVERRLSSALRSNILLASGEAWSLEDKGACGSGRETST